MQEVVQLAAPTSRCRGAGQQPYFWTHTGKTEKFEKIVSWIFFVLNQFRLFVERGGGQKKRLRAWRTEFCMKILLRKCNDFNLRPERMNWLVVIVFWSDKDWGGLPNQGVWKRNTKFSVVGKREIEAVKALLACVVTPLHTPSFPTRP